MKIYIVPLGDGYRTYSIMSQPPVMYRPIMVYGSRGGQYTYHDGRVIDALLNATAMPTKRNQYLEWDTETQSGYLYTYVLPKGA